MRRSLTSFFRQSNSPPNQLPHQMAAAGGGAPTNMMPTMENESRGLPLFVRVLLLLGVWWCVAHVDRVGMALGMTISSVRLEGSIHTDPQAVRSLLAVNHGDSLLGFDVHQARTKLLALPWVRDASVRRDMHGRIYVRLTEHQPFALWRKDGAWHVMSKEGVVIQSADGGQAAWHKRGFQKRGFPMVMGAGANKSAFALWSILRDAPLSHHGVSLLEYKNQRRWDVHLQNGVVVMLPENNMHAAWQHFLKVERQKGVLKHNPISVDLRLSGQVTANMTNHRSK